MPLKRLPHLPNIQNRGHLKLHLSRLFPDAILCIRFHLNGNKFVDVQAKTYRYHATSRTWRGCYMSFLNQLEHCGICSLPIRPSQSALEVRGDMFHETCYIDETDLERMEAFEP